MDKRLGDLAVVIPTLNEQFYIGKLLDSLTKQTVLPKEIVVVDAFSEDETIKEIVKRQSDLPQLQFFQIPKYTISKQRNYGAKKTSAPHLLFLDADMVLKAENALEKYLDEVIFHKPDMATAKNLPLSDYWKDRLYFWAMNQVMVLASYFWPVVTAMNMYFKREWFEKIGGFDEEIRIGEDAEILQRTKKAKGIYKLLGQPSLHTSVRRFRKEGRIRFVLKMVLAFFIVLLFGFKRNMIKYELGKFGKEEK